MLVRSLAAILASITLAGALLADEPWDAAAGKPPMTADETKAFIGRLLDYVEANHLRTDDKSPQRGMVYEYFDVNRKGQADQWVQGEALDTMHDGAWLAIALANAARATGNPRYGDFLTKWQLPFYTKMLNHSDTLFDTKQVDVAEKGVRFNKEHALQTPEKGFVPYWWDDGASVSLERRRSKDPLAKPPFACTDRLAGTPNPKAQLSGYSHGSSNHLAQDLGPMLQQAWLLLQGDPRHKDLAAEVAAAAKNLHECRMRHHGVIPAVAAAAALTNNDAELMTKVSLVNPKAPTANHTSRFLGSFGPQKQSTPGFADDTQYTYYSALARHGKNLPPEVKLKVIYDAFTEPMLFAYWSDNAPVPPGINRFDLIGHTGAGGKFDSYRSDRPVALGSRFGPQNMVCCGWAAQMLRAEPTLWDDAVKRLFPDTLRVPFLEDGVKIDLDGQPEASAVRVLNDPSASLHLVSTRTQLVGAGDFAGGDVRLKIAMPGAASGKEAPYAHLTIAKQADAITAKNHLGEPLTIAGKIVRGKDGERTRFEFALPYTVVKGQKMWGNAIELGRLEVSRAGESTSVVFASPGEQVGKAVERQLAIGLRTWEAIFAAKGYIPTGLGAGKDWDQFSDVGGYAHLISAAAEYLMLLDGRRDWEVWRP